ncbi:PEP-CTERM sorting domain-containing protein [Chlorobaculum thiosulfatiphilum]|uniref:PEP-CTERM sorting domain-containing protein n=1 Tax=Chlorobaculum thiosulfatiphilum TaxID=115852 RepID=UPI0014772ACD|nr:PEP-CTERM sorting domain-containing protein [Chlorobaculum thiosulfatiphilum]
MPVLNTITLDDIAPTPGSSATKLPDGVLQLTDNSLSDPEYQIGSAYSTSPVGIETFNATFSFQYSGTYPAHGSADGIVFVIKNPASATSGGDGGGLGYGTITTGNGSYAGIPNSVGIEFDNWYNPEVGDPSSNHIGINVNGSVVSQGTVDISPEFNGSGPWYAWVDYDGSLLSVSVNQTNLKPDSAMLSYNIGNIQSVIDSPAATVGFTGSTGWATQTQQVLSFDYNDPPRAVPEPGTVTLLGIGGALVSIWTRRKRLAISD